jgi:dTDP-4-dehydrorhamnose 3,5-epimerase
MQFTETPLRGAWIVELDLLEDERGWFARVFDSEEFEARGMDPAVVQSSISFNARRDTLRGMHFQAAPHGEPKLVRCIRGAVFDVAIDLRPESPTFCAWHGVRLDADDHRAFYIPPLFAHGFQTLTDDSEVLYQMGRPYVAEAARGVRFDDPVFGIEWPAVRGELTISEKDRSYPDFRP